jgi:hypothetical protein
MRVMAGEILLREALHCAIHMMSMSTAEAMLVQRNSRFCKATTSSTICFLSRRLYVPVSRLVAANCVNKKPLKMQARKSTDTWQRPVTKSGGKGIAFELSNRAEYGT